MSWRRFRLRRLRDRWAAGRTSSRRTSAGWRPIKPVYTKLKGWRESTEGIRDFDELPTRRRSICGSRSGRAGRRSGWFRPGRTGTRRCCCRICGGAGATGCRDCKVILPGIGSAFSRIPATLGRRLFEQRGRSLVSFIVKMRFAQEDRAQVTDILRNLAVASRQESGV